jgi:non-specific serine/threonine protein kinase
MSDDASLSRSIPQPRTPLVGREREIATAGTLLMDDACPLLTLTGPGGVGKTRLALAIAHARAPDFAGGTVFVDLAPIADPELVPTAIAQAIGVRQAEERPIVEQLVAVLRSRQVLLVLDNLEQVLAASAAIAALLEACPALQILATSRAPLHIRGEQVLVVPPLDLPDGASHGALGDADAVVLFLQRAREADAAFSASDQDFAAICEICRRLDGLPLAIELAAARTRLLSPAALLEQVSGGLQVLAGGARDAPARQRSLRDTIAWSYDLLAPDEQALFRRLSVFAGGFTLEAAEAVGREDGSSSASRLPPSASVLDEIAALVESSLVRRAESATGQPRYTMLETVRAFAAERLEASGETDRARRAHAEYVLELVKLCASMFQGPDQKIWVDRLDDEHANIRVALAYYRDTGEIETELLLARQLWGLWYYRGPIHEGVGYLVDGLARAGHIDPVLRSNAHSITTNLAWSMGETELALEHGMAGIRLGRATGDPDIFAFPLYHTSLVLAWDRKAWDEAIPLAREAAEMGRAAGPKRTGWLAQIALGDLGTMMALRGDREAGVVLIEQALAEHRALGHHYGCAIRLAELALVDQLDNRPARAAERYAESLQLLQRIGDATSVAQPMAGVVGLAAGDGRHVDAARVLGMLEAVRDRVGVASQYGPPAVWYPVRAEGEVSARAALGEEAFSAAFAAGRNLSLAEAVSEAIALSESIAAGASRPAPVPEVIAPGAGAFDLSEREMEVLRLLARRWTDAEIAESLFVSPRTVNAHARSIFAKLDVANRREAAAVAARHGLA